MAKAPVYQRRLYNLEIPKVDFAAERSVVQAQKQMASDLASMNTFVQGKLEGMVKEKAKKYGVENAPTIDQLQDVYNHNKAIDDAQAIPEDKRTDKEQDTAEQEKRKLKMPRSGGFGTFSKTANAYALDSASKTIETLAKKEMLNAIADATANETSTIDLQNTLTDIVDGFTSTIADEDVVLAKSLNADLNLFAYTKAQSYALDELDRAKKQKRAKFMSDFLTRSNVLPDVISYLGTGKILQEEIIGADGKVITDNIQKKAYLTKKHLDEDFAKYVNEMVSLGFTDTKIEDFQKLYNDKVLQSQITVLKRQMLLNDDPVLLAGNIQKAAKEIVLLRKADGSLKIPSEAQRKVFNALPKEVLNAMLVGNVDSMLVMMDEVRKFKKDENDFENQEMGHEEKVRKEKIRLLDDEFGLYLSQMKPDMSNKDTVIKSLKTHNEQYLNYDKSEDSQYFKNKEIIAKLESGISFQSTPEMYDNYVMYNNDLNKENPVFNTNTITLAFANKEISFDHFVELSKLYRSQNDKNFREAVLAAKARIGIPVNALFNGADLRAGKIATYKKFENMLLEARDSHTGAEPFDAKKFVRDNIENFVVSENTSRVDVDFAKLESETTKIAPTEKMLLKLIEKYKTEDPDRARELEDLRERVRDLNAANPTKQISDYGKN